MSRLKSILVTLAGTGMAAVLIASGATADVARSPVQMAQVGGIAAPQPEAGDCKSAFVVGIGNNPAVAQAAWVASVATQHGKNWAHWVGAKNKTLTQLAGAAPQFMARAQPCFYHPVP
jgi:hypothetical protein